MRILRKSSGAFFIVRGNEKEGRSSKKNEENQTIGQAGKQKY